MIKRFIITFTFLLALPVYKGSVLAQTGDNPNSLVESKTNVVTATKEYKESLEKLLTFYEDDVKKATEQEEKRQKLFEQGIISKRELEEGQKAFAETKAKVASINKQIEDANGMIAEAEAAEELAKIPPSRQTRYSVTPALIRFQGLGGWLIKDVAKVENFFSKTFHRSLPISAYGQSTVHDKLGFDHSNAIDVAVQPESPEGQALMNYLRAEGIPFLAFKHAIQGVATGAHIHIGEPSTRILRTSLNLK